MFSALSCCFLLGSIFSLSFMPSLSSYCEMTYVAAPYTFGFIHTFGGSLAISLICVVMFRFFMHADFVIWIHKLAKLFLL